MIDTLAVPVTVTEFHGLPAVAFELNEFKFLPKCRSQFQKPFCVVNWVIRIFAKNDF